MDEAHAYYDAVAAEYDQAYVGGGPAISGLEQRYRQDVAQVSACMARFGQGHLIDLACGTAFWVPFYAPNCRQITLVDQSPSMLSSSRARVDGLGLGLPVDYVEGDVLQIALSRSTYDSALVGFLLSHLTSAQEETLFQRLNATLKPGAMLAVIDSVWSEVRKPHRNKDSYETRTIKDGRTFSVYKRYFEPSELELMLETRGFEVTEVAAGDLFVTAVARRRVI